MLTISNNKQFKGEHAALHFRNIAVIIASMLFILSIFIVPHEFLLRGLGYLFGAIAYFLEFLILTDNFTEKVPKRELFMVYCFGPLYVVMCVTYLVSHFR